MYLHWVNFLYLCATSAGTNNHHNYRIFHMFTCLPMYSLHFGGSKTAAVLNTLRGSHKCTNTYTHKHHCKCIGIAGKSTWSLRFAVSASLRCRCYAALLLLNLCFVSACLLWCVRWCAFTYVCICVCGICCSVFRWMNHERIATALFVCYYSISTMCVCLLMCLCHIAHIT